MDTRYKVFVVGAVLEIAYDAEDEESTVPTVADVFALIKQGGNYMDHSSFLLDEIDTDDSGTVVAADVIHHYKS